MDGRITIKDINGNYVVLSTMDILEKVLANELKIYDLGLEEIRELKYWYDVLGGKHPISVENIKECFSRK